MTDNQKRAHDMAIFTLGKIIDFASIAAPAAIDGNETVTIDFYEKYKEMYIVTLNALNRDFPDGK